MNPTSRTVAISGLALIGVAVAMFLSLGHPPVRTTVTLGSSRKYEEYLIQNVKLRFCNASHEDVRVIGFTPFCCSGLYGFAVAGTGAIPERLKPGETFELDCEASFSANTNRPEDRLERVAGQLLLDLDNRLVTHDVSVCIKPNDALASLGQSQQ